MGDFWGGDLRCSQTVVELLVPQSWHRVTTVYPASPRTSLDAVDP